MSVMIKDMKMPSACISCDFCNPFTDEPYCRRLMRKTPKATRLKDCPLVEVSTPHGRLIDGDILESLIYERLSDLDYKADTFDILRAVQEMSTIIGTEEKEK